MWQRLAGLVFLGTAIGVAPTAQACDRDCVVAEVDAYVEALVAHDPARLDLHPDLRSTQNGVETAPGDGVWQTITAQGGYRQTFVDSQLESAVFFGAFEEDGARLLMAIRFAFEDGRIRELEHLLSRPDWRNRLIDRHQLEGPSTVYETVLPAAERLSRGELAAAADAYFDGIARSTDEGVPMHAECRRRENGVLLLHNPAPDTEPCPIGFHRFNYITDVRDRRVAVVDEARGLVLVWAFFDVPGNIPVAPGRWGPSDAGRGEEPRVDTRKVPRSLYIAELFRVVDGGIRDIEAIMYNMDLGATAGW